MEISLTYETEIYYIIASWKDEINQELLTPRCENSIKRLKTD